ncbi:MAG: hypothetical protein RLZZ283_702 [Candidatus Parcubacteria bacterium]|jgi:hypothetical protein
MEERKLEEMYEMVKSNHSMLKSMRRTAFVGGIVKFVFYIVILFVLPYYTWLYIQPYLENVLEQYQQVQGATTGAQVQIGDLQKQIESFGGMDAFKKMLESIGVGGQ